MADMNNQDIAGNIETIRNALGNPDGCKITYIEATRTYTIAPQEGQKEVRISVVNDIVHDNSTIHLFEVFSFSFQKCVFEIEISLEREIYNILRFSKCTFNKNVNCINAIFRNLLSFSESTFEQHAFFSMDTFDKGTQFLNNTFKGMVDFQNCHFNDETSFSRTIFEQKASFSKTEFNGKANFDNAHFKMETTFSGSNFKEKVQFKETTFDNYAHLDNVQFGDETKSTKEKADYDVNFSIVKFNGKTDFSKANFQYKTYFQSTNFSDYTNFNSVEFVNEADFLGAHFEGGAYFTSSSFKQNACFKAVTFHSNANFDHVKFQVGEDCKSESIADFSGVHFKERAFFTKAHFHKMASFSNVTFDHNAYFDETKFEEEANFQQSEFYMNAHFYGTIFKEIPQRDNITMNDIPNFLQIILNGYINLTNTKQLLLSFEQLKSIIDGNDKKEKDELANEFRNTFKNFKNGLIKDNNLIDASQFHKMELYAKELEASYKKERSTKDWTEKIQLMLYRLTSDHHTDLLLILNNVFIIIALFSAMNFAINYFDIHSLKIGQATEAFIACFTFLMLASLLILDYGKLHISFRFSYIQAFFHEKQGTKKCFRACVVFVSHITATITLVVKPSSFVPIFGKLIDECFGINSPTITSLNIVYAILMFLLIWSLQKTARKNTIVPN